MPFNKYSQVFFYTIMQVFLMDLLSMMLIVVVMMLFEKCLKHIFNVFKTKSQFSGISDDI